MRKCRHNKSNKEKDVLYKCPECGLWYKEKMWAKKCQTWCKKYQACSLEITKHAVKD